MNKKQTIIKILQQEQRPLTPKEICFISKSNSNFKPLNHSTVKVYCRQLLHSGKVNQHIHGYYEVTKDRYGVLEQVQPRVHDLRLVWVTGSDKVCEFMEQIGDVKINCQVGSIRGKVNATIGCDQGLDYQGVCFAVDFVRRLVWEKAGINLDPLECVVSSHFNEDYQNYRLDGVKCVTVQSFLGDLERFYNKANCLRSEVGVEKTNFESMMTLLKGGVSSYNLLQSQFMILQEMRKLNTNIERLINRNSKPI